MFSAGEHLFLEIIGPNVRDVRCQVNVALEDIPQTLTIEGKEFQFRPIISIIAPPNEYRNAIGHYVTYVWRPHTNRWECYDDLADKKHIVRSKKVVPCQVLMYTFSS